MLIDTPPGSTDEEKLLFVKQELERFRLRRMFACPECREHKLGLPLEKE